MPVYRKKSRSSFPRTPLKNCHSEYESDQSACVGQIAVHYQEGIIMSNVAAITCSLSTRNKYMHTGSPQDCPLRTSAYGSSSFVLADTHGSGIRARVAQDKPTCTRSLGHHRNRGGARSPLLCTASQAASSPRSFLPRAALIFLAWLLSPPTPRNGNGIGNFPF